MKRSDTTTLLLFRTAAYLLVTWLTLFGIKAYSEESLTPGLNEPVSQILEDEIQKNWQFVCPDDPEKVGDLKRIFLSTVRHGLASILNLNPNLSEHIVNRIRGRTLIISCEDTISKKAEGHLDKLGVVIGAEYTLALRKDKYGNLQKVSEPKIYLPGIYKNLDYWNKPDPFEADNFYSYRAGQIGESNSALHEFLHFLMFDNFSNKDHNEVKFGAIMDVVYSCSNYVYNTFIPTKWTKPEMVAIMSAAKKQSCETCALARSRNPWFFTNMQKEFFSFGLSPNMKISNNARDRAAADAICSD